MPLFKGRSCLQELLYKKIEVQLWSLQGKRYSTKYKKYGQNSVKHMGYAEYYQPKNKRREYKNTKLDSNRKTTQKMEVSPTGRKGNSSTIEAMLQDQVDEPVDFEALVRMEIEMLRLTGHSVPKDISPEKFQELLSQESYEKRQHFLHCLCVTEKKETAKPVKELMASGREEQKDHWSSDTAPSEGTQIYGVEHNTVLGRICNLSIDNFYKLRLVTALQFGQPFVVDMDFDKHLKESAKMECCQQLCVSIY